MSPSKIQGAYGTMYYVRDMPKAVAYYKECFGLSPRYESPEWTEFDLDGHLFCLHGTSPGETVPANGFLVMKVSGLHEMVKSLRAQGVEFEREPREIHPGAYCVAFRDTSGNRVDLYEDANRR